MPGSYARQKGHSFERSVAQQFREAGFTRAKTSRQTSRLADDCKIDITGVLPYAPQCKNMQGFASANEVGRIDVETYAAEIEQDATKLCPLVITKAKNKEVMAILPWKDLLQLIAFYKEYAKRS